MAFFKYITVAAAVAAPAALAQFAAAPASTEEGLWPSCAEKLMGGATHSLVDIVEGFNGGEETVLMPLIDEIEPDTFEILTEFDVAGEGYTLLLPFNQDKQGTPLGEAFPDLNSTATLAMADDIIRAHIIPGTLQYADIEEAANATGEYTVESLQGFEWTFGWAEDESGGGYPFLVDQWNVTKEGEIEIQMDISNQPDCPNRIIGINGFVVTPDLLDETPAGAPTATTLEATPRAPVATPGSDDATPEDSAEAETPKSGTSRPSGGIFAASAVGAAALATMLL